MSLPSKYTGLILASGEMGLDPTLPVLEALSPFKVTILQSSLLTIRNRYVFSLLIELSPDHRDAIATDLDQVTASGVADIAYDFAAYSLPISNQEKFICSISSEALAPSALLPLQQLIAGSGTLEHFDIESRNAFLVAKISFSSELTIEDLKERFGEIAKEHRFSFSLQALATQTLGGDACLLDMDSTFINEEVIDILAEIAGVGSEVSEITELAMQGELDFRQSLKARVALLKGQPESIFDLARSRITATKGASEFVDSLHKHGCKVGVVSGGFHDVIDEFSQAIQP
jgi:phosphoserine phosphatase